MPTTAQTALYLLLGLAITGGVLYVLAQITGRQRRLHAELARLEQLTAEVAMTAEAMLDRIDERIDRLNRIADRVESKVKAGAAAQEALPETAASLQPITAAPAAPAAESSTPRKRGRPRKNPQPEVTTPPAPAAQAPAAEQPPASAAATPSREEKLKAVFAMAAEGKSIPEIAAALSMPRGEVQLILNLRKVTA